MLDYVYVRPFVRWLFGCLVVWLVDRALPRQEMKAESRNVELNKRLFRACEMSFAETCPLEVGLVEVEAMAALSDERSERLLDCMLDKRAVSLFVVVVVVVVVVATMIDRFIGAPACWLLAQRATALATL